MLKICLILSLLFSACTTTDNKADPSAQDATHKLDSSAKDTTHKQDLKSESDMNIKKSPDMDMPSKTCSGEDFANITGVTTSGTDGAYQFSVSIKSPDTGCEQYANWWEVLDENGKLIYRRILGHSHVAEQPFTRSGGPANVNEDTIVIVRAHMNPGGYGSAVFKGSVKNGFSKFELDCGFAASIENEEPLPKNCAF